MTQLGVLLLRPETPLPLLLAVTVVVTFGPAWASWHGIEKPALRLKPSRGTAAAPVPGTHQSA